MSLLLAISSFVIAVVIVHVIAASLVTADTNTEYSQCGVSITTAATATWWLELSISLC